MTWQSFKERRPAEKRRTCDLCKDSPDPIICLRCYPSEFAAELGRVRPGIVAWARALQVFPFEHLDLCGHCGKQRARSDGFCGHCGVGNTAGEYVSYQVIAGRALSDPSNWSKPKPVVEKPVERQVVSQILIAGPVVGKPKRRRSVG